MILENSCKLERIRRVFNGCAQLSVNVETTYRVGFSRVGRKITPNDARYLRGDWKTKRATNLRQQTAALTTNEGLVRHG